MLSGPLTASPSTRRRRTRPGPVELAAVELSEKLRLGTFGRIYFAAGVVLCVLILYVSLAARLTQTSYEITRLQAQQADLVARQEQLRYTEANLQAPGQVQHDAAATGMQRGTAARFPPSKTRLPPNNQTTSASPAWADSSAPVLQSWTTSSTPSWSS